MDKGNTGAFSDRITLKSKEASLKYKKNGLRTNAKNPGNMMNA